MELLLALAAPVLAVPQELVNPSFEEPGLPPPGWRVEVGAYQDPREPEAHVAVVDGHLELSADADTRLWYGAYQDLECEPGEHVRITARVRTAGLRREGDQFSADNLTLGFNDENGERMALLTGGTLRGDRDWFELELRALSPARTASLTVGLFLANSGTVAFDDVRVELVPTDPFDEAARAAAYDALAFHLERNYPFFGVAGKPMPGDLLPKYRDEALAAGDAERFLAVCAEMLGELDDLHISFDTPRGKRYLASSNPHPQNWNDGAIRDALAETVAKETHFLVGPLKAGPAYVRLGSFSMSAGELERLDRAMDELDDAPSWILDARPNWGGRDDQAWFLAGRFTDEPVRYGRARLRDPTVAGEIAFQPAFYRFLQPREGRAKDERPVAVLQGPYTVSSGETFVQSLGALPGVTTVGLNTRGASANPQPFQLLPGYVVNTSRWQRLTLDGEETEGIGLAPDVEVKVSKLAYLKRDPTLEKAIELLAD